MSTTTRIATGIAILAGGTSLAFAVLPSSTTAVRVAAGIACAVFIAIVFILLRKINMDQAYDSAMETLRKQRKQMEEGLPKFRLTNSNTPPQLPLRKGEVQMGPLMWRKGGMGPRFYTPYEAAKRERSGSYSEPM